MSKISKRIEAYGASEAFKKLNPSFFNPTHQSMVEPSKSLISNPGKKLGHSRNDLSGKFLRIWKDLCGPTLEEEFRFHPERKFRVDFCHLPTRTCIEIEGNIFNKRGGHSSITGILRDIEKYNEMAYLGFRLFRFYAEASNYKAFGVNVENITRLIRFLERKKL